MLFLTLVILLLIFWTVFENFKDRPPGPFRLPLLGNILQLAVWKRKEPYLHIMLQNFSKAYGPFASLKFGMVEQVIIDDTKLMREILQGDEWAQRPVSPYIMQRSFGKPLGILFSRGEMNKELRRFSIRTLRDFGFGKQKSQDAVMEEELRELMGHLDKQLMNNEAKEICMHQFFNISVLNIIWSMVASVRFSHDDPEFKILVSKLNAGLKLVTVTGNVMIAFPFLRFFKGKDVRVKCIERCHELFLDILKERRASGSYKEDQNDFIDVFASEIEKAKNSGIYTEEQFLVVVFDLFGAGSETTSNTLEYCILLMMLHPTIQDKVREEIDRVLGREKFPNYSDKLEMPTTEATLNEILRISSVVPLIVRSSFNDVQVGGYKIPKETFTILNTYSAHRDPKIWENPEQFDPQRFLDKDGKVVNGEKLIPFGLGKRYCIGEVLARATLFTYFVTMLQNYTFELPKGRERPSLKGLPGLTLSPQKFYAIIKKRE